MSQTEPIEVPGFVWSALQLAAGALETLVDPERGVLTALHKQGVSETYEATRDVGRILRETIEKAQGGAPWDSDGAAALVEFLDANIALWRATDESTEMYVLSERRMLAQRRALAREAGGKLRELQSGNARSYASWVVVGAVSVTALLLGIWMKGR